jgi:DNA-binding MarR family transcriptional regulator
LHSSDEHHFGWITADVSRLMRTVFDRRMRKLGLTRAQWLALTRLHRRPGASQQELADMMEIEKAPAGRILDRLQDKGWIERRADATDRRINRIYLTERGERIRRRPHLFREPSVRPKRPKTPGPQTETAVRCGPACGET